jgi:hypothetical protein
LVHLSAWRSPELTGELRFFFRAWEREGARQELAMWSTKRRGKREEQYLGNFGNLCTFSENFNFIVIPDIVN